MNGWVSEWVSEWIFCLASALIMLMTYSRRSTYYEVKWSNKTSDKQMKTVGFKSQPGDLLQNLCEENKVKKHLWIHEENLTKRFLHWLFNIFFAKSSSNATINATKHKPDKLSRLGIVQANQDVRVLSDVTNKVTNVHKQVETRHLLGYLQGLQHSRILYGEKNCIKS